MSAGCLICLEALTSGETYHDRCVKRLFGTSTVPRIEVEVAKLHTLAGVMVQHATLSGTQRKISLGFAQERATLRVAGIGGIYILKPQTGVFPSLPENEHVTMRLGALFGLEIPPCGLVRLNDASLAFIIARFDRAPDGRKVRQEDFCQLAQRPAKEKYRGLAERCAKIIQRYSGQPGIDLLKLYRQLVCSWWVGNNDLHLKNLSLIAGEDGRHRLSPAYDLVSTMLVILEDDRMALPMGGRERHLTRRGWLDFAASCGIPTRAADRVLAEPARLLARAESMAARSQLPAEMQTALITLLRARAALLTA